MKTLPKYWSLISKLSPILVVVLIVLLFRQCEKTATQLEIRESARDFLNDTVSYYENELGRETAYKKTIEGDKKALEILLSKLVDSAQQLRSIVRDFRTVDAAANIVTVTKLDTIYIPYSKPVELDTFSNSFNKSTDHYSLSGAVNETGITFDSLSIPNTLSFAIGKKKTGLFRSEFRIEAVNSNPYVKTVGLDSYSLKIPERRLGLGLYVGYGLSENFVFRPSAGISLTYNLLFF